MTENRITNINSRDHLLNLFKKIYNKYLNSNVNILFDENNNKVTISNGKLIKEILFHSNISIKQQIFYLNEIIREAFLEELSEMENKLKNKIYSEFKNNIHVIFFVNGSEKIIIIEEYIHEKIIKYYLNNIEIIKKLI